MPKTILSGCLLAVLLLLPATAVRADANAWRLVSNRDGIRVYTRDNPGTSLKSFRGVTQLRLRDEYALVALLNDYPDYPDWLHFVDGARELGRRGPLDRVLRFTTLLPWPLEDREGILDCRVRQEPGGRVVVRLTNRPDALPPSPHYVRFPELSGELAFERLGDDRVRVTYQLTLDPGGYIPNWLTNILLRDAPYFTLERLRQVVHRPRYQGHYYGYLDLRGPGRPAAGNVTKTQ